MKKGTLKILNQLFITLGCVVFLSNPSFAEPLNLSVLKQEIQTYHDSGLYEKELEQAIIQAQSYILEQAALNARHGNKKNLAIVLDIDETSLTNYTKMVKRDFVGDHDRIHQDILAADAPAITPMLSLYTHAIQHGVKVFFITGRAMSELKATKANLHRAGFNHWGGLYLRPDNYHYSSIIPFKSQARKAITQQGYTIIASIGDQERDLKGGFTQKGFKLPNPFYHLP